MGVVNFKLKTVVTLFYEIHGILCMENCVEEFGSLLKKILN